MPRRPREAPSARRGPQQTQGGGSESTAGLPPVVVHLPLRSSVPRGPVHYGTTAQGGTPLLPSHSSPLRSPLPSRPPHLSVARSLFALAGLYERWRTGWQRRRHPMESGARQFNPPRRCHARSAFRRKSIPTSWPHRKRKFPSMRVETTAHSRLEIATLRARN